MARVAIVVLAALAWGCGGKVPAPPGTPWDRELYQVELSRRTGPFLEVLLYSASEGRRIYYFPPLPACEEMLVREASVAFEPQGALGRVSARGQQCPAIGTANLAALRDDRPRPQRVGTLPRATARFRTVGRQPDAIMLRGRFPLATLLGFAGAVDLVALLPLFEPCRAVAARGEDALGEAALEYRHSGPHALVLNVDREICPIAALIQPLEGAGVRSDEVGPQDAGDGGEP